MTTNKTRKLIATIFTAEDMQKIRCMNRAELTSEEQFCLDLFVLGYYTGGMSLRDMAYLTADKIEGGFLNCETVSYPNVTKMKLNSEFMKLIDRYKADTCDNYLLPIFTQEDNTHSRQERRLEQVAAMMEKTFHKIETITGCEKLTWYEARQAYVDYRLRQGDSVTELYQILGDAVLEVDEYYWNHPELGGRLLRGMRNIY